MGMHRTSAHGVQTTRGTTSDLSVMLKGFFLFSYLSEVFPVSFPGIQVSMDADQHPREQHKPWGGEAFLLLLHAASPDSILLVTAPGEEISPLFPEAQMEIEDRAGRSRHGCSVLSTHTANS